MNFYISDMHWGQENVIPEDQRPFENAEDCFRYMQAQWNRIVNPHDHVYIIGDCLWAKERDIAKYLAGLHGYLHLVIGNHDANLVAHKDAGMYFEEMEQILEIEDDGHIVVMCHYPLLCWNHKNDPRCIHVFGHVHRNIAEQIRYINTTGTAYNAGCMINHYRPVTLRELAENNLAMWGQA